MHVRVRLDGGDGGARFEIAEVCADTGAEFDDLIGQVGERFRFAPRQQPVEISVEHREEQGVQGAANGVGMGAGGGAHDGVS